VYASLAKPTENLGAATAPTQRSTNESVQRFSIAPLAHEVKSQTVDWICTGARERQPGDAAFATGNPKTLLASARRHLEKVIVNSITLPQGSTAAAFVGTST
jgi:hypothetical protein